MLDVTTAWVKEMKGLGVTDLSTGKLMGLKALHVGPEYIGHVGSGIPGAPSGQADGDEGCLRRYTGESAGGKISRLRSPRSKS